MIANDMIGSPPPLAAVGLPQIDVRNVSKSFGKTHALKNVSMTVAAGETRALLGRNGAGKSTLVGLLTGMLRADTGEISIGQGSGHTSLACVYQHSRLVPAMTVAENIVMGRYPRGIGRRIDWREVRRIADEALEPWGLGALADRRVADLAPVQMKVVEVCRALAAKPTVLMLDEPTAGLDRRDAEQLFTYIERLKQQKVTLIYVSHHLNEIYRFCDSATVLRDARVVLTSAISALPRGELIDAMTGLPQGAAAQLAAPRPVAKTTPVGLAISGLKIAGAVERFDLQVRRGECVGIAGLEGSGKAQIGAAVAGLVKPAAGTITVDARPHRQGDVLAALRAGIGYVPENRHQQGMVPGLSVAENSTMTAMRELARPVVPGLPGVLRPSKLANVYRALAAQWEIVASGPDQPISELSGGNQQKCVMARALATRPKVLVLQNPTAGVDVAAKASIMRTLSEILARGASVVVISEDADDFALAARIVVVNHGRIGSELAPGWSERDLVSAMQGSE